MSTPGTPAASSLILYQTEDGQTRLQCRLEGETLWLTQIQMAELFQTSVPNINLHLKAIYGERELVAEATIKSYLIVRAEGPRQVSRPVLHYNLPVILAVGFRVRSHRGTQFRQWATTLLSEYLVKGFTLDDERLKNPPGKGQTDYFDELLARIRDIRSSERRFYQKVLDIYATSIDYTPDTCLTPASPCIHSRTGLRHPSSSLPHLSSPFPHPSSSFPRPPSSFPRKRESRASRKIQTA